MGFEVIAGQITNLEQIISFAIQQNKVSVIVVALKSMNRVMPEQFRAELPELPVINNMNDHLNKDRAYWNWIENTMPLVYEKVSAWQHAGFIER